MSCPTGRTAQQLEIMKLRKELQDCKTELDNKKSCATNYENAYDILMEYFECIPEDERQEVSDRLDKYGL